MRLRTLLAALLLLSASAATAAEPSASKLALRTVPSTEDNTPIGEVVKGDAVLIYFKTGDFYYIQVVATGVKCYAAAKYIIASTAVPTGTPVP